jgi:hypothetical protein
MTFSKPISSVGKGQLRCFKCRAVCAMKDGNWHDYKNQQVFLCKTCGKAEKALS